MSCDLTSGRLRGECVTGRAGVKSLYFTKYNDYAALTGVTESGGEITSLGTDPITIYQFDMESNVGNFDETPTVSRDNGTAFLSQSITLTLFYIKPIDLAMLNNLKKGRWAVWALDFEDKIRFFGQTRGMVATSGSDVSGVAPGDKKGLDLVLQSVSDNFAPFMADYTTVPFDNYANVTVITDDLYGAELYTLSNAIADPNGTEADAITGWSESGLNGTGANVFESQAAVKAVGGFAFHVDCTDTPTATARIYIDLEAAPFSFVNGEEGRITFNVRNTGTGGGLSPWTANLAVADTADTNNIVSVPETQLTFIPVTYTWTHDANHRYLNFREQNGSNAGGLYIDNMSIKKKL
jgi:hypothetical protein